MKCQHFCLVGILGLLGSMSVVNRAAAAPPIGNASLRGPLRVHPDNPRYFTDGSGRAILLTGSHTWNNLVDMGPTDPPKPLDFEKYMRWLSAYPHNFLRLWTWELTSWDTRGNREKRSHAHFVAPHPWQRTGPGKALDGKPKFDLSKLNDDYFDRLRRRVSAAGNRGIYVAVMLFEGWGIQFSPGGWERHPFHPDNNVNGINGDLDGDGRGLEIHSGRDEKITEIQRTYVRRVIDTVNEFDNVLYEISNENHPASTRWQYQMIRFIKRYEKSKPKQHPVGMTFQYKGGANKSLFDSPADWISPNPEGGYRNDPPVADGSKVIINDTDHLWGIGGNSLWVWKSFLRGHNPIFMDPYDASVLSKRLSDETLESIRRSMGYVLAWSRRVDLAGMTPSKKLASSGYCLARAGIEYLVLVPAGLNQLNLTVTPGAYAVSWFDMSSGREFALGAIQHASGVRSFKSPFKGDALLYLKRASGGT